MNQTRAEMPIKNKKDSSKHCHSPSHPCVRSVYIGVVDGEETSCKSDKKGRDTKGETKDEKSNVQLTPTPSQSPSLPSIEKNICSISWLDHRALKQQCSRQRWPGGSCSRTGGRC